MTTAIVKFNALPDPVRATAQNYNFPARTLGFAVDLLITQDCFILSLVGRIKIRRISLKLCRASINPLEGGHNPVLFAQITNRTFGKIHNLRQLRV